MSPKVDKRVGVVVVHGIGEQRRFEHVDNQVRSIVSALRARPNSTVTVNIASARAAAFQAEQDTWTAGPTVQIFVSDDSTGEKTQLDFHEVWWADVNEPYSFFKQLRFWRWGLTLWLYPDKQEAVLPTSGSVQYPTITGRQWLSRAWVRLRLFGVAFVAVVGATSIGLFTFFAERVLKLKSPDLVRVFVNYVAGVKLYNQKRRLGAGFPAKPEDFLDTIGEPPRVSVRRRMIRSILEMAEGNYERWYIVAHSLGSVVAFNGLMETAYAWPGYLSAEQWERCLGTLGGPAGTGWNPPPGETMPARPVWVGGHDVAYRSRIFRNFHGLLTFGSPLEKFATLWPARVPISREPAFRDGTTWLNVFDPIDPVSGELLAFRNGERYCCPAPQNVGYAAGPLLLLNHLKYLSGPYGRGSLADGLAEWLMTGNSAQISTNAGARWFAPRSPASRRRDWTAWFTWAVIVLGLAAAGGVTFPIFLSGLGKVATAFAREFASLFGL